jgi:peptide/nickel transport system substrate-binding protein
VEKSPNGLTYEFKLRRGLKFHNGDPVTTEDVKFSYDRYKGAGANEFQARVRQVEVVDPLTIRFHLKEPWPDFMTFYDTTATAAGIVVPKTYIGQVGDEGFRKHPIGAGPYKFVSRQPGVEVVLEANPGYRRHAPHVKRVTMKSVPEGTTRVTMLKKGEADIAYALGAGGLPGLVAGEEAARAGPRRGGQLGQRGQPGRVLHVLEGPLRVRRLPGDRRPVPAAGQ